MVNLDLISSLFISFFLSILALLHCSIFEASCSEFGFCIPWFAFFGVFSPARYSSVYQWNCLLMPSVLSL
ncbi:hypothetical protein B0H12DRAFT_1121467 [Mycena haematopus]|nr:hypothetical protein B0H12DRAFT_1121467 [Mycena haematopus]